jgi:hypoxanthine phosphoribosyltransferase
MIKTKIDWADYGTLIELACTTIKRLHAQKPFTHIIAVGKGGLPLGVAAAHAIGEQSAKFSVWIASRYTNYEPRPRVKFTDVVNPFYRSAHNHELNVLVTEDVIDKGVTIREVGEDLAHFLSISPPLRQLEVTYAALVVSERHRNRSDILPASWKPDEDWVKFPYEAE